MQHQQRWKQIGSMGSLDGLARSTISLDVPEARNCREAREQSRVEMHALNEKLASQLEKMRFLSEQNKKLMEENQGSRGRYSKETEKLKQTYNNELRQLRQLVDDCEREKADSLAKMATLQQNIRAKQDQIQQLNQTNQKLSQQLDQALKDASDKDADKMLLQRHIQSAEDELERVRSALDQVKQSNQQLHTNLDDETASRMACQAEMQTLREEMEFIRTVHEQELDELRALANADHEHDRDQWREEMQKAIRDIQVEYDRRLDKIRTEMDANYANRLSEATKNSATQQAHYNQLCEDNQVLKGNLDTMRKKVEQYRVKCENLEQSLSDSQEEAASLRNRLENALKEAHRERQGAEDALTRALNELSALTDTKLSLETEIAAYRRLLEAQDTLISDSKERVRSKPMNDSQRPKELRVRLPSYSTSPPPGQVKPIPDHFSNSNRWNDRDEPSGQSARSHMTERPVEGTLNGSPDGSTKRFSSDPGVVQTQARNQQLSCSYSDTQAAKKSEAESDKISVSHNEKFYRGQLSLVECAQNGSYIEMNNKGNTEAYLSGWCLIRNIDHGRQIIRYTFPDRKVPPNTTFRVWAAGQKGPHASRWDFEALHSSWGTGNFIQTNLYSPDGVVKATHTQRVDYSP
ncbi:unnamed protein product [Calicophoron daubneyi]|uniref:Uncharacterized protein n=1 Tax=Calicophoron daubneyi TaxID=300641 RepID=A0AAV2TI30_CALDB